MRPKNCGKNVMLFIDWEEKNTLKLLHRVQGSLINTEYTHWIKGNYSSIKDKYQEIENRQ